MCHADAGQQLVPSTIFELPLLAAGARSQLWALHQCSESRAILDALMEMLLLVGSLGAEAMGTVA